MHAATSIANELEACRNCGLRADQFPWVEVDVDSCPGCEAKARKAAAVAKQSGGKPSGEFVSFFPATDGRNSVWAQHTQKGTAWRTQHREPGPVFPTPDDLGNVDSSA